jgi:signal transduction histidine kinase/DNA-binding response OmpR family regulator
MEGRTMGAQDGSTQRLMATVQDITAQKELELQLREAGSISAFVRSLASAANESETVARTLDLLFERMAAVDSSLRLTIFQPVQDEGGALRLVPGFPGRDTAQLTAEQLIPTVRETELAATAYLTQETQIDDHSAQGRVLVAATLMDDVRVAGIIVLTTSQTSISKAGWQDVMEASLEQVKQVFVRERTNAALARARDLAMAATRQKSEFLATMSHEIRTPMNGVIGLNDLLLRTALDSNQQRLAQGVQAAGRSLLTVINDILDFSKIEAGKVELESLDFELQAVLDQVLSLLGERAHEKGIELAVEVLPEVPAFIRGDPNRLAQIVTNLVSNAVKFTAEGEVVVRCSVEPPVGGNNGRVGLRFEVRDTGIGIASGHIAGLFDAFSQAESSTTRNFGGTGLGLAISRQLVAAIGGQIGVESQPGVGSTFWFTGQFETGDPALVAHTSGGTRHLLEGRRVLVVDDSATSRRILAETLTHWHIRVESAADAQDAVERIRRAATRGEAFDIVLLDLLMPNHDGLQVADMINSATDAPWPLLILLSSAQSVDRRQLEDSGIALSLTKPVGHSALFDGLIEGLVGVHGLETVAGASATPPSPKLGQRILVVEDNEINQMVAQGVLEILGYDSDVAGDGLEAVAMAASGDYDAIVMDVQMPRMDGYEATRSIRSKERSNVRVPIIAMTAGAVEGEDERCLAAGMDAYLTKPLEPTRLEETLRSHIQEKDRAYDVPVAGEMRFDPSRLEALRVMGGDASPLVARIVGSFVDGVDASLSSIRGVAASGDAPQLARLAHRLRGSAANLGAIHVSQLCLELETRGRAGDAVGLEPLIRQLSHAVAATVADLERELAPR